VSGADRSSTPGASTSGTRQAGGRYVRHALIVRRLLYRAILFIPAASAVWALLPVVAARNLRLGSAGYGLMLGMVGIGAVAGAVVMPRLRAKVGSARLVSWAMVVTAAAMVVVGTAGNAVMAAVALLPVGAAWIAVMSSLNSGLQLALPNGVRARGLAYYLVVFQGARCRTPPRWTAHRRPTGPHPNWSSRRTRPTGRSSSRSAIGSPSRTSSRSPRPCGMSAAHTGVRGAPLGAVPRRQRPHPVRRVVLGRHLGRAPAPAREPADRRGSQVRG